jgi:hypothetical protein
LAIFAAIRRVSHVVLFSIGHRLQDDEKAVDLTAMILGYQYDICDAEFTETKGEAVRKMAARLSDIYRGTSCIPTYCED